MRTDNQQDGLNRTKEAASTRIIESLKKNSVFSDIAKEIGVNLDIEMSKPDFFPLNSDNDGVKYEQEINCVTDAIHFICDVSTSGFKKGEIFCHKCPSMHPKVGCPNGDLCGRAKTKEGGKSNPLDNIIDDQENSSFNYPYKHPFGIWFRGHSRCTKDILPKAFRKLNGGIDFIHESGIFNTFQLQNPEHGALHHTDFDWLTLMQHYELPTRLLDWTESVLYALYFAVRDRTEDGYNGELLALNARRLNAHSRVLDVDNYGENMCGPDSLEVGIYSSMANIHNRNQLKIKLINNKVIYSIEKLKSVEARLNLKWLEDWLDDVVNLEYGRDYNKLCGAIAVFPSRINSRMSAQLSMFTLHGGKIYGSEIENEEHSDLKANAERLKETIAYKGDNKLNNIFQPRPLNEINEECEGTNGKPFLCRFKIPYFAKPVIREQLMLLGIHEDSVFPEMEYQANYLKELWKFPTKNGSGKK